MYHIVPTFLVLSSLLYTCLAGESAIRTRQSTANRTDVYWQRNGLIGQGPRQEHSVAAIGKDIYVVGGIILNAVSELEVVNRVELYNTESKQWSVAAPLPEPLNHPNIASANGNLYSLGGLSSGQDWVAVNSSNVYTPFNDVWTSITALPNGTASGSSAMGVYNNTIYLAGRMTILQISKGNQDSLCSVIAYDILTDTWRTDLPPLPSPRQHVGGVVVDSIFYVIGGRENGTTQYHNTTFALDLSSIDSGWKELAPIPTARGSITCSAIDAYIYCFGGEGNPDSPLRIFNNTEVYDIENDVWTELPPMEVPRHGTGSASVDGVIYIPGGGYHGDGFPDVPQPGDHGSPNPVGIIDSLYVR